ncbi:uncharacterized protein LOC107405260 isoform X1 [Ziziphus jujuba]|uniref:Uncharacterized protein LOC107405260 isoform X1 n=1 Tax=Ziziphus jujuba TaxID=326968 RepID=A0ABM3IF53_ZIZJJ|nr:uncharacterized protein LOC107405260 isoform X1 [Ziziphus jujuba]XP_060672092.1 uncharacterized protein LOC107405260 isoform X1 [Ziziphus jujuba]XP_060672093.1 uncharacterized protein LOC107405260 isoform X1 [Ziziphus jujuba]
MVLLHHQIPSRKRPSSFVPPLAPNKTSKSTTSSSAPQTDAVIGATTTETEKMVAVLAEAGCTLINPSGPPCLPADLHKLRRHLQHSFSYSDNATALRSEFLAGFSSYLQSPRNLRRVLTPAKGDGFGSTRSESLARNLLLVPSIQLDLLNMLLEKLPEYFHEDSGTSLTLEDDVPRLIINHFRWLDFVVDPNAFTDKLMQVLSICPLHLKKEIIGSLPEIIGDQNNKTVVESLEQMLQEDSSIAVTVLDSFSNLNLDDQLQEQVTTIALSCIRTVDEEHMPHLLRFLLLSATPANVRRIISHIREQLKFVGVSNSRAMQQSKLKGKSHSKSTEASILEALRSSLRFKNTLCQEILKELNCLQKPRDHKVIDIWLLMLIHMNGESPQKNVEKMFKKKIMESCIQPAMFDQCICGHKDLAQDYFPSFISLSEYLLACKEKEAREFGIHMYTCLFNEFDDSYSRQEVLGSLVTNVGSGVSYIVSSALETMSLLASKYAQELIPLSSHISGILDYLEGFNVENLHKVYEVFSHLALLVRTNADSYGSSFANELFLIVRKQVSHPELKYKKMGLIGTLKIVSGLGDANSISCSSLSQKSNSEEALELLKMSLDSCKQLPLSLITFYDEMTVMMDSKTLHPIIMEWVGKHVGEFESIFLSDLDGGKLPVKDLYCGLEGELWMNLDGDISPICLSILPLTSSSLQSSSLQVLPANFLLLSTVERMTNQGSLGGIDALLGCPLHLPSSKYFFGAGWKSLTGKQKQIMGLSLYYAFNWIHELLNAFCTQVAGRFELTSQATKDDIIAKLLKRLRNLVFLESLLNYFLQRCALSLPELHLYVDHCGSVLLKQPQVGHVEKKNVHKKTHDDALSDSKRKRKKISNALTSSDSKGKLRQPTILDVLKKPGASTSQEMPNGNSSDLTSKANSVEPSQQHPCGSDEQVVVEISAVAKALEAHRHKFRHILVQCFSILTFSKCQDSCCPDSAAELPLFLYLLRDLHHKLDCFTPPGKQFPGRCMSASIRFTPMTVGEFLSEIRPLFPSLRKHFDTAFCLLKGGDEICQEHWKIQSISAGNPDIPNLVLSTSAVSTSVFKEILHCFCKIINLPDIQMDKAILSYLLEAFQPINIPDDIFSGMQLNLSPGTIEYLYFGAYLFVEGVLDAACSFSFMLASESLFTLESIVTSVQTFLVMLEGNGNHMNSGFVEGAVPILKKKLETSAQKLLRHKWDGENLENGWRSKGEVVQKILCIYLENSDSTSALLDELACSILPQASSCKGMEEEDYHGFPTLSAATFIVWYRVLHERNLAVLNRLAKEVVHLRKPRAGAQHDSVDEILVNLQQYVNVVVSLVSLCRTYDKVTVHAMAVKYGGKFVDTFLKVFDFLKTHFEVHNKCILQMVKELQKATRTIQTLCSEAKGLKRTVITSKIPATKRSMERFLFHVKALLHETSSGCTFWMGNLKHKDLTGQVVSSQAYANDQDDNTGEDMLEVNENPLVTVASEEEKEME